MTRISPRKAVPPGHSEARLGVARDYHKAARSMLTIAEAGDSGSPILSLVVSAAVAYADALTARSLGAVNQQDHAAAVRALRDALGNGLPAAEENRAKRLLSLKDEVQYGARRATLEDARRRMEDLDAFARWAEAELSRG
jgi:TPR repeat protein